jgi:PAS domain S-box-containing protein
MTRTRHASESQFAEEYTAALRDYLRGSGEAGLQRAYELGRQALAGKLGVLDMGRVHHEALVRASADLAPPAHDAEMVKAATRFFIESLTPFEMTHRGVGDLSAELRASDERFRELFENANDIVFMTDLAGNFLSINRAGERITGYSSDEIRLMNFGALVAPEYLDVLRQMLQRKHGEPAQIRYELEIVTKDGRRVPLEISIRPIAHEAEPVGVQGIARDVTDRREAERALHALNQRLEEEARRIAHALHDEAGQMLASVYLALAEVAAELPSPARARLAYVRALLEQVEAQLRRLSHELRPTILDDWGLIPTIEFLAEGVATRTGISVVVTGSTGGRLPTQVETALYRTVQEGLTNVTKHAHASRATVHLERHAEKVVCSIRDDGRGFEASERPALTDRQGLGLIGIRERVAAFGGMLSIASRPGVGTTLEVVIPLKPVVCHPESSSLTTT